MDLAPDFNEFIGSLNEHGVEFLIVGAHAVAFLGRETFLQNKRAAARPKDLADFDALEPGADS